jgi:hypothetical protein
MMAGQGTGLNASMQGAVQNAFVALRTAVAPPMGAVTPATQAQVQNSLDAIRHATPYSDAVRSLEAAACSLRILTEAKRNGRCNLYMSQLLRLRRQVDAAADAPPVPA